MTFHSSLKLAIAGVVKRYLYLSSPLSYIDEIIYILILHFVTHYPFPTGVFHLHFVSMNHSTGFPLVNLCHLNPPSRRGTVGIILRLRYRVYRVVLICYSSICCTCLILRPFHSRRSSSHPLGVRLSGDTPFSSVVTSLSQPRERLDFTHHHR